MSWGTCGIFLLCDSRTADLWVSLDQFWVFLTDRRLVRINRKKMPL